MSHICQPKHNINIYSLASCSYTEEDVLYAFLHKGVIDTVRRCTIHSHGLFVNKSNPNICWSRDMLKHKFTP